jgi:hypothetical protein
MMAPEITFEDITHVAAFRLDAGTQLDAICAVRKKS